MNLSVRMKKKALQGALEAAAKKKKVRSAALLCVTEAWCTQEPSFYAIGHTLLLETWGAYAQRCFRGMDVQVVRWFRLDCLYGIVLCVVFGNFWVGRTRAGRSSTFGTL